MRYYILDRTDPAIRAAAHRLAARYSRHVTFNDVCSYGSYDDADHAIGFMLHGVRVTEKVRDADRDRDEHLSNEARP